MHGLLLTGVRNGAQAHVFRPWVLIGVEVALCELLEPDEHEEVGGARAVAAQDAVLDVVRRELEAADVVPEGS